MSEDKMAKARDQVPAVAGQAVAGEGGDVSKHQWYDPNPSGRPSAWRQCARCHEWNTSDEEDAECEYLDAYVVDAWMAYIEKHDAGHVWTSAQVVDLLRGISHGIEPKEGT